MHVRDAGPDAEPSAERWLAAAGGGPGTAGLTARLSGELVGFLVQVPSAPATIVVGIGPPAPLGGVGESFRLATRALETAAAFGLVGAQPFADLGARPAVLADADVGAALVDRYVAPLHRARADADTLILTVERFLASGLHVETAANSLFVHQNTLRYRLRRFRELTGADLGDPETVLEVWWALSRVRASGPR